MYLGNKYLQQSEKNRLRVEEEDPIRGFIYDRKGRLLVENAPSYIITSSPANVLQNAETLALLREIFYDEEDYGWEDYARKNYTRQREIKLKRDIEFASLAKVEANKLFLNGIDIKVEPKRRYPYRTATHILGYLGEISSEELSSFKGFQPGDIVGKKGVEKAYNSLLFGTKGYTVYEVDVQGNKITMAASVPSVKPLHGSDIYLTIDLELQSLAEELLKDQVGAVVAIDPKNGDIFAIASSPDYNPEYFSGVVEPAHWNELVSDTSKPLLNRTIQGTYPPGSVTKMAILAAALEEGVVTTKERITCGGFLQLGRRPFKCWNEGGHGSVNAQQAIERSCDVYFYQMGLRLGIDKMAEYLRRFGLGKSTGIDIENEMPGLVPDSSYMDKRYGANKWTRGHLLNTAIGQGDILVTPLQLACYCAGLANRGKIPVPHLFRGVLYHNPDKWEAHESSFRSINGISTNTWDLIVAGMYDVVQGEKGTAHWLNDPKIQIAGKTGTSQNPHGEDHAWFIGFGPFENPQIAVCALVEHGEHGSTSAAPIVFKIIKRYLQLSSQKTPPVRAKAVG